MSEKYYVIRVMKNSYYLNAMGDTNNIEKAKKFKKKSTALWAARSYCPDGYKILKTNSAGEIL